MIISQHKIEKSYILDVLEDGVFRNAREIRVMLESFGLKCKENTVRKDLHRYSKQGLLVRKKIKRVRLCYHYGISEKGRKRLAMFRAKSEKKREANANQYGRPISLKKDEEKRVFDRWIEVVSTLKLYKTVLSLPLDITTLEFAKYGEVYWSIEYLQIVPKLPEEMKIAAEYFLARPAVSINHQDHAHIWISLLRRREEDCAYIYTLLKREEEEKEKYKKLADERDLERRELLDVKRNMHRRILWAFEFGQSTGKLEAETEQNRSMEKIIFSSLAREQKEREEAYHPIPIYRNFNDRWWNLLPQGSGILLPVRGP